MVDVYRSLNSFHRYENRFRDMRHFGNEILNFGIVMIWRYMIGIFFNSSNYSFLDGLAERSEGSFCETTTVLK